MNAQKPAEGILTHRSYGDAMRFKVACECGCGHSDHDVWVEADAGTVTVEISTEQFTDYWSETVNPRYDINNDFLQETDWFVKRLFNGLVRRLSLTKDIWFSGRVKYEAAIIMSEQQALNYSAALASAVESSKQFKANQKHKTAK